VLLNSVLCQANSQLSANRLSENICSFVIIYCFSAKNQERAGFETEEYGKELLIGRTNPIEITTSDGKLRQSPAKGTLRQFQPFKKIKI